MSEPQEEDFSVYEQYVSEPAALFQDLIVGDGRVAESGDSVAVVYKGWLTDGSVFDQSRLTEDGKIQAFSLKLGAGQVIAGWEQTLPGMKVGGKRRLVIPPAVGYGAAGTGGIPPNAVLIFDVELVQVDKSQTPSIGL